MKRRVLLMISSMRGGGSEQQTLSLLRHLDRDQFEPHLYLTERTGDLLSEVPDDVPIHAYDDYRGKLGAEDADARLSRWFLSLPGQALRRQCEFLAGVIRTQAIDVVYDRTFHMTLIAGPAARIIDVPRVSTIVSPPDRALPSVETRFVTLKRWRLARTYKHAHRVIAVSRIAATAAERFYRLSAGSIEVIENAVDINLVRERSKPLQPSRDDRTTFVCVGRMTHEKGHQDLIQAVAGLPEEIRDRISVWMIGDGPLRSQLQRQCETIGVENVFQFFGQQPVAAPWIAAADGLILPSHFEGMPNVVLEAMALGVPVIATRAGGTVELERDEPTILWAEPQNSATLTRAIESFMHDPEGNRGRTEAATQLVTQFHDISNVTRKIEQRLNEAVLGERDNDTA